MEVMITVDLIVSDLEDAVAKLRSAYRKACRGRRTPGTEERVGDQFENVILNLISVLKTEIELAEHALSLAVFHDNGRRGDRVLPEGVGHGGA